MMWHSKFIFHFYNLASKMVFVHAMALSWIGAKVYKFIIILEKYYQSITNLCNTCKTYKTLEYWTNKKLLNRRRKNILEQCCRGYSTNSIINEQLNIHKEQNYWDIFKLRVTKNNTDSSYFISYL